jgi:hypothetical protein
MIASFRKFEINLKAGEWTAGLAGKNGTYIESVESPIQFVLAYLSDSPETSPEEGMLIISGHITGMGWYAINTMRNALNKKTGVKKNNIILFSSHNHCAPELEVKKSNVWQVGREYVPENELSDIGKNFMEKITNAADGLIEDAQTVGIRYAVGSERGITYNRKGYRADGTSYFIREEDRKLLGEDYSGEIDPDAEIILFENNYQKVIGGLVHFTGHPVTSYHPEKFTVYGEWPQDAAELVSKVFNEAPIGFLQGCCGDINSKEFLSGRTDISKHYGDKLGKSFLAALSHSRRMLPEETRFKKIEGTAEIPFTDLPDEQFLINELNEIDDFIARAESGDENTRGCVGLNFPAALSPSYRGLLVKTIRPWTIWALEQKKKGRTISRSLKIPVLSVKLGDVLLAGYPCEAFSGVGKLLKQISPIKPAIPCCYMNSSYGYIPDSGNVGGKEYMSSFYRYTRFWPPFNKPGGDVLAYKAAELAEQLLGHPDRRI